MGPPFVFNGTVENLYRTWIEPMAPEALLVKRFDRWLARYCTEDKPVFPVRYVKGLDRRRTYKTCDGTYIAPADNSPTWAVHAALVNDQLSTYSDFREFLREMPSHIFDMRRRVGARNQGYYFAHLLPAKNGDTAFQRWRRREVERRYYLTLHPCNFFLVPGGRAMGENQRVIRYVARMYEKRYGDTWRGFLARVGKGDAVFGPAGAAANVQRPREAARPPFTGGHPQGGAGAGLRMAVGEARSARVTCEPSRLESGVVRYRYGRLCFKRDIIEPLTWEQSFEVITPFGCFRFTKRQFYAAFPRIPKTHSYRGYGRYHGAKLHLRAKPFRVPG